MAANRTRRIRWRWLNWMSAVTRLLTVLVGFILIFPSALAWLPPHSIAGGLEYAIAPSFSNAAAWLCLAVLLVGQYVIRRIGVRLDRDSRRAIVETGPRFTPLMDTDKPRDLEAMQRSLESFQTDGPLALDASARLSRSSQKAKKWEYEKNLGGQGRMLVLAASVAVTAWVLGFAIFAFPVVSSNQAEEISQAAIAEYKKAGIVPEQLACDTGSGSTPVSCSGHTAPGNQLEVEIGKLKGNQQFVLKRDDATVRETTCLGC